jgi:hypothetical protein
VGELVLKTVCLRDSLKDVGTINVFQAIYSTAVAWQHATLLTTVNGFHHWRCGCEPHTKADQDEDVSAEENKNAFCKDRIWLDTAGVMPVQTVNWCGGNSGKSFEKGNKHDPKTAISFIDIHAAHKIVTTFINVYCIGEQDEQNIFDLELLPARRSHRNLSGLVSLQSLK